MSAWMPPPVEFHSSRAFECGKFTPDECEYYQHRWHFWYEADHVFALPTVAFFMSVIGVFALARVFGRLGASGGRSSSRIWRKFTAIARFLSYRGYHFRSLRWNSASVGVMMLAAVGTVFFFCMTLVPQPYYWPSLKWGHSPPLATRSGWMALACMPFIFATASKTNWITLLTGVSHEKLHVFHRWISYAFLVLALFHTFPFIVYHIHNHDMVLQFNVESTFEYWTGVAALIFQAWLTFASFSSFRKMGYEFFKAAHFLSAVIFVVIFFWHCAGTLTSWDYFVATAAVYVPCLGYSWIRTMFEYGFGQTAQISIEDNGFLRVTIPANFHWVPGQHCFLRFRGLGMHAFTSHPFTICSLPATSPKQEAQLTFCIRQLGGLTTLLYNHAIKHPHKSVPVLVDGPYGGIEPQIYDNGSRVLVIAGGSGAGWSLAFLEHFLRRSAVRVGSSKQSGSSLDEKYSAQGRIEHIHQDGPRSMRIIIATRDAPTRRWFQTKVKDLLESYAILDSVECFDLEVYLTGEIEEHLESSAVSTSLPDSSLSVRPATASKLERNSKSPAGESNSVPAQELLGRPDLPSIVRQEASDIVQAGQNLNVYVCGPLNMQDDVRNAVAAENLKVLRNPKAGGVYLHLEHFSWA